MSKIYQKSERDQLSDFKPLNLSSEEFQILGKILGSMGLSDSLAPAFELLAEEEKCGRRSEALLAMSFLLDRKNSNLQIPLQISHYFLARKIGDIKNRKDLGDQALLVHLLMAVLNCRIKNEDLGLLLFPLLELAASQHVEVSTLALECLERNVDGIDFKS